MAILWKVCKPDNFESHNSLKLGFTNIWGLHSNFVDCESFLESNSPDILALCEANLDDSIDSGNFCVRDYLPLIQKDSTIMDIIIFWDFLILYQIFFWPQMKRSVIISNKHGMYELLHELPNDLRLKT